MLENAKINFKVIDHNFDEESYKEKGSLKEIVTNLAIYKSNSINFDKFKFDEDQIVFLLSADTLVENSKGEIFWKPKDKAEAINMIKSNNLSTCGTGFCLKKYIVKNGSLDLLDEIIGYEEAKYKIIVPEQFIEQVLIKINYLDLAGGMTAANYGEQFLKYVEGSYTTILGLPIFEVREALMSLGFYDFK